MFRVVIPARHASTRLPGKPLLPIAGEPMILHVHRLALRSGAAEVVVATDDARIRDACLAAGAAVEMTGAAACVRHGPHRGGRKASRMGGRGHRRQRPGRRAAAAAGPHRPGGGTPGRDPGRGDRDAGDADRERRRIPGPERGQGRRARRTGWRSTSAARRSPGTATARRTSPAGVGRHHGSRRHLGLYAYRVAALLALAGAAPAEIERRERLEQLRALAIGLAIVVADAERVAGPGRRHAGGPGARGSDCCGRRGRR